MTLCLCWKDLAINTNTGFPIFPNIYIVTPFHFEQVRLPSIMTARELPLGLHDMSDFPKTRLHCNYNPHERNTVSLIFIALSALAKPRLAGSAGLNTR